MKGCRLGHPDFNGTEWEDFEEKCFRCCSMWRANQSL